MQQANLSLFGLIGPMLLGIRPDEDVASDSKEGSSSDEGGERSESDGDDGWATWKDLPRHRDEDQVQLDVNRSFVYYPNGEATTTPTNGSNRVTLMMTTL